jgi:hypothetical protein
MPLKSKQSAVVKKKKTWKCGGGGVKHITVVTEKKIMPRAIYKSLE